MIDLRMGSELIELPYTVRVYDVDDETFDRLVDEDTKAELLDGVMIVHSPVSPRHDQVVSFVQRLLTLYVEERGLGVVLGPDSLVRIAAERRVAPDAYFLRAADAVAPLPKEIEALPQLVVEVLSPSNRDSDLIDKRRAYRDAGVSEAWFIDKDQRRVIVDTRDAGGVVERVVTSGRLESSAVTGFWLDVAWLWSEPPPSTLACLQAILGQA
jgi:Uma2 family endonuclease